GTPLIGDGASLRCGHGHSFDRARDGYWNLVVVQHKASSDPGDSKEMVTARRRFLNTGLYSPIAAHVFETVRDLAVSTRRADGDARAFTIADAGCGEGYYLQRLVELAAQSSDTAALRLAGFDVSKWAVQAAAKRRANDGAPLPVRWLVANNRRPPFAAQSIDLMLCLFGFPVWEGFRAAQAQGGAVLLIDPGPDHLIELRRIIYPDVTQTEPQSIERAAASGYWLVRTETVRFSIELETREAVQDLVAMTPHAHRMPEAGRMALAAIDRLLVTVDVVARLLTLD
ncbi:MAG: putative RNA methyltransferase, partial [Hyphomicrobiaceae bacterium]